MSENKRFQARPGSWFSCRSWFHFPTFLLPFAYLRGQSFIRVIGVIRSSLSLRCPEASLAGDREWALISTNTKNKNISVYKRGLVVSGSAGFVVFVSFVVPIFNH